MKERIVLKEEKRSTEKIKDKPEKGIERIIDQLKFRIQNIEKIN